jgi:hypothetical protein
MGVSQLGYFVFNASNIEAWRDLAASVIGAEERRDEGSDLVRLRFDEHHHRITLRPAKTDSIVAIGWEMPSLSELESVRRKVTEHGFAVTEGTREDLADRKVGALIRFRPRGPLVLTGPEEGFHEVLLDMRKTLAEIF